MAMGRPKAPLILNAEQKEQLEGIVRSRALPAGLRKRARIVSLSAAGRSHQEIAKTIGMDQRDRREMAAALCGLSEELRPGRPRSISDERVAQLVRTTLETKPKEGGFDLC